MSKAELKDGYYNLLGLLKLLGLKTGLPLTLVDPCVVLSNRTLTHIHYRHNASTSGSFHQNGAGFGDLSQADLLNVLKETFSKAQPQQKDADSTDNRNKG